jgi:RNA polymerase sigma factor (sigma-70 family)
MADLYNKNVGLFRRVSLPYVRAGMDIADAMQESYIALEKAVSHYNPEAGPFVGCLASWVKAVVGRAYRSTAHTKRLPDHLQEKAYRYKVTVDTIRKEGRTVTDEELEKVLGLSGAQLDNLRRAMYEADITPLSQPLPGTDGLTVADVVADPIDGITNAVDNIASKQDALQLWAAVDALEPSQAQVIRCRYKDGMTIKDTAEKMDISSAAVSRRESSACRCLRNKRDVRRIAADHGYTSAIYRGGLNYFKVTHTSTVESVVLHRLEREEKYHNNEE